MPTPKQESVYQTPESDLQAQAVEKKKGWKLLTLWCCIVVAFNLLLTLVVAGNIDSLKSAAALRVLYHR